MRKITINTLLMLFLLASCTTVSTKKIGEVKTEDKLEKEYCSVEKNDKYYRAKASVRHPDLGASEYSAIIEAKALLSENIKATVKFLVERSALTRTNKGLVNYTNLQEGITRFAGEVDLGDVEVICTKVIRMKEEGMYQRFVAIEMSKEAVINDIENKISKDDAMYQDYRRSEMRKLLEAEL
jgi:hypothetical protein